MIYTATSLIDSLLTQVCENPEDWDLRRVLADAYEDNGDLEAADCSHWTADNKKRALKIALYNWYGSCRKIGRDDPGSDLPVELFHCLPIIDGEHLPGTVMKYNTRLDSEKALLTAWRICTSQDWVPHPFI